MKYIEKYLSEEILLTRECSCCFSAKHAALSKKSKD
jgi:hypothetical protein